jgi:hypothetical protein
LAVTGKKVAPPLFVTLAAVGQGRAIARLREAAGVVGSFA